jgi:ribosomal protein S18 acetylase RimI-like enzyme
MIAEARTEEDMACTGLVRLRRAGVDDAAAIATVHVRTWKSAYRGLMPQALLDSLTFERRTGWWKGELELARDDRRPWVAVDDDRVVGFVHAGPSRDDDAGTRIGEVYAIYVDPECQGKGIGRDLLRHATRDLRTHGFRRAILWVLRDNRPSQQFYEAAGWADDGADRVESLAGFDVREARYSVDLN